MSRRTEMAYKAQSPGKSAQPDKAPDSGDRVNVAVVLRQFTFLSLGGLSGMWYDIVSSEITGRGCRLPNAPAQTMESRSGCGKAAHFSRPKKAQKFTTVDTAKLRLLNGWRGRALERRKSI